MFTPQSELFKGMEDREIREVLALGSERSCARGTMVYLQGDPACNLYVLEQGKVRLRIGEQGHVDYMVCDPGEVFGLSAAAGRDTFFTSAECLEDSKIIQIEAAVLKNFLDENPRVGLAFYRNLSAVLLKRLLATHSMVLAAYREGTAQPSYG